MNLYDIVTNDEYEIPVKCDLKVKEVANFLGISTKRISQIVSRPIKKSKYKVIVSGKVEHDQNLYNKTYSKDRSFLDDGGCQELFEKRWDGVVDRLKNSHVDLSKIKIVKRD